MADSNARSNPVNVEQIVEQIRGRIREQRGGDYTEQQLQEAAAAQLEKFLDPRKARSNLLEEFRRMRAAGFAAEAAPDARDDAAVFETDRGWLRAIRFILRPFTRLLLNTRALATVLMQSHGEKSRRTRDQVLFELIHNLVVETARLDIEVKNLKMRNESLAGRVEFNERRVRVVEGNAMTQPARTEPASERSAAGPATGSPGTAPPQAEAQQERTHTPPSGVPGDASGQRRRRRRRRGRRGGGGPLGQGIPPASASQDHRPDTRPEGPPTASPMEEATTHDDGDDPEGNDGGSDIEPQ